MKACHSARSLCIAWVGGPVVVEVVSERPEPRPKRVHLVAKHMLFVLMPEEHSSFDMNAGRANSFASCRVNHVLGEKMKFGAPNLALLTMAITFWSSVALADGATHELSLIATTMQETDCGGGSCVPACVVEADLTGSTSIPVPLDISIWYKSDHTDAGRAALSFYFDGVKAGAPVEAKSFAPGYSCKDVVATEVDVECNPGLDEGCPGIYLVQIPDAFGLASQKVEGK